MNTPENTTTNIGGKSVAPETEGVGTDGTTLLEQEQSPSDAAETRVAQLQAELDRQREQSLRDRADLENTRKRLQREREEGVQYANLRLLEKLLPVLDNFEMGMIEARKSAADSPVLVGMSMVQKQLEDFLRDHGVQPIDAVGQKFDPNLHEALGEEASADVPEGQVVRQLRKGFKLRERLLRPANVFVSKGKG
jgi:molecular chaperone GrpE